MHTRRDFLRLAGIAGAAMVLSCGGGSAESPNTAATEPTTKEEPDKKMLTVALLQMLPKGNDQEANLKKADDFCRQAAAKGADIALMPEMFNIGYSGIEGKSREAQKKWQATAVPRDGAFVRHFADLARELGMAIACTYLEQWPVAPRNSVTLFDRTGKEVFTYAKVHTCDFERREASCTPGEDFYVAELDTAAGKLQVGAMICYDREHPESARILMVKGAELILTPNACMIDELRMDQFKVRAYENAVGVAMANYPPPHEGCNGHSVAFNANGEGIVEAKREEGLFLAEFNLDEIREIRRKTIWGDAFRRPHRYKALTEVHKKGVFERTDALGRKFDPRKR